jgi:hypothetical protein
MWMIVAVSGMDSNEKGQRQRQALSAQLMITCATVAALQLGACRHCGRLIIIIIKLPNQAIASTPSSLWPFNVTR